MRSKWPRTTASSSCTAVRRAALIEVQIMSSKAQAVQPSRSAVRLAALIEVQIMSSMNRRADRLAALIEVQEQC
jgi:hypothetical protein